MLLVLPGSRRSEIRHHMADFGATLARLAEQGVAFEPVLPTMPHLQEAVAEGIKTWPVQPRVVVGEPEKRAAFRIAHAALAKSGTVTLELAISGVPMVTAYRTGAMEAWILRRAIKVNSVILANLVVGENVVPEFLQEDCTPEKLAAALRDLLGDSARGGSRSRRLPESTASCRPATSRPACARPISCWRRCGSRGSSGSTGSATKALLRCARRFGCLLIATCLDGWFRSEENLERAPNWVVPPVPTDLFREAGMCSRAPMNSVQGTRVAELCRPGN